MDFPGNLSAVLFCAGCNYDCYYCHNRALLGRPPLLDEAEVLRFLEKRAGLLDGVVFSGGEAALQRDLPQWMRLAKGLGYHTKLDTNGSRPEAVAALLGEGLVDYVAVDYKAPFELYEPICGQGAAGVRETLALLMAAGVDYELRTTMIPQITRERLVAMAQDVPPQRLFALQYYVPQTCDAARYEGHPLYTPGALGALREAVLEWQPNAIVRA